MKKLIFCLALLFFVVGCAEQDLPPSPPAPGGDAGIGRAVGGVQISQALPSWAAPILYSDITPERVKYGDRIAVTVDGSSVGSDFLVYKQAYAFNKKVYETSKVGLWEGSPADSYSSGTPVGDWYQRKAVFYIPVSEERFPTGLNYVVIFWCFDSGTRDAQNKRVWNCNNGKWGLGAFEVTVEKYPDILIERNIENNVYKGSVKGVAPADGFVNVPISPGALGDAYTATYVDAKNVKTEVSVVKVLDVSLLKKSLANSSDWLEPKWTTKGGITCGFLLRGTNANSFSWLSDKWWLNVKTFGTLDEAKIGNYATVYDSDCNLLLGLKALAGAPDVCGNSFLGAGEQCEKGISCADSSKLCNLTTCTCYTPPVVPVCNNTIKEGSEECERGIPCANASDICSLNTCKCTPSGCGNNIKEAGEQCEKDSECPSGKYCIDCECVAPYCGDDIVTPDEDCEWDEDCSGDNICVDCRCVAPYCGDTFVTGTEECDINESCTDASKTCDLESCTCIASGCGNKVKEAGEECEIPDSICTKNNVTGTCGGDCKCNICGDYKINQPFEQCEPPGSLTCDENCTITGPASGSTLYVCRKSTTYRHHGTSENIQIYDHYLSTSYPCDNADTQRIQARLLPLTTIKKADMVKIVQCHWPERNDHRIAADFCPSGTTFISSLGLAYKIEKPGTIPLTDCAYTANGEHFTVPGNCPKDSTQGTTWYALPFCEESDKSRNLMQRGITKSLVDNSEYVDTCEGTSLKEYSCDELTLPNGVKEELVTCPTGYTCKDGACVVATAAPLAETVPLVSCMRRTMWHPHKASENIHIDDYYSDVLSSSGTFCSGGSQLSIQGRLFKEQQENTVPLMNCFWHDRQEYYPEANDCGGANVDSVGELGFIYPTEQPGTIPLRLCLWEIHNNEEHFATTGTCPDRSRETGIVYILPSCEDTDGGKIPRIKGWIDAFDTNWKFTPHLFEDSCDGTAFVKEYYCNAEKLPYGYSDVTLPCPAGTRCNNGACVAAGVGQALYLGEAQGELGSDVILLILSLLAIVIVFVLNLWHWKK